MFAKILKSLRTKRGLSQATLSKELNLAQQTYGHWETGRTQPDHETLVKLANYFNVTTDFLLGSNNNIAKHNKETLLKDDLHLLNQIKNLPPDKREIVDTIIKINEKEQSMPHAAGK